MSHPLRAKVLLLLCTLSVHSSSNPFSLSATCAPLVLPQRNYPSFFRFLIAICALNALTAAAAVWHGIVELVAGNVTTRGLLSMVLAVYTVAMIPFTWGMAGFHVYLTCRGRTTYEHVITAATLQQLCAG